MFGDHFAVDILKNNVVLVFSGLFDLSKCRDFLSYTLLCMVFFITFLFPYKPQFSGSFITDFVGMINKKEVVYTM